MAPADSLVLVGAVWVNQTGVHTSVIVLGWFGGAGRAAAHRGAAGAQLPHLWQNFCFFPPLRVFCMPANTSTAALP